MLKVHDTAVLVTPIAVWLPDFEDADWIGIDAGCNRIVRHGHACLFAIGDFDSGRPEEEAGSFPVVKLPVAKDETDTEAALKAVSTMGYARIFLIGAFGGRLDHTIANLRLLTWQFPDVVALEEKQRVSVLLPGTHVFEKAYRYLSFFAQEPSIITLSGFDYPLDKRTIDQKDLYTCSNSIAAEKGTVILEKGRVLCVESNIL